MSCSALWPAHASAEFIALQPLTLFYPSEPRALGIGLPVPIEAPVVFNDPLTLIGLPSAIGFGYQYENILREDDAKLASQQLDIIGILNFDLPHAGPTTAGLRLGDFSSDYRFSGHDETDITQDADEQSVTIAAQPSPYLSAGFGVEHIRTETHFLYAVEARIPEWLRVKYREARESAELTARMTVIDHEGELQIAPDNTIRELTLATLLTGPLNMSVTADLKRDRHRTAKIDFAPTETLQLSYRYTERQYAFADVFVIDGTPEGTAAGDINAERHALLFRYVHNDRFEWFSSAQWSQYRFDAGGRIRGEPLFFFWDDLVLGERRFAAEYTLEASQYAVGVEYQRTPAVTLRSGIQYLSVDTTGAFNHWTPIPLLGFGKLDEETISLPYKGATFGGISFGISYRRGAMELSYALSQLLPLERRTVTEDSTETSEDTTGLDSNSALNDLWSGIRDNPGGNLHVLRLSWSL